MSCVVPSASTMSGSSAEGGRAGIGLGPLMVSPALENRTSLATKDEGVVEVQEQDRQKEVEYKDDHKRADEGLCGSTANAQNHSG